MSEFLELLPPQEALQKWMQALPAAQPGSEHLAVIDALGRITAGDIHSPEPLPAFDRSTVDGYAVHAADTYGANESLPAYLTLAPEVLMGEPALQTLVIGQAAPIFTGGMLPPGADAVVMQEYTQLSRPDELEVMHSVAPLENLLRQGEDVQTGSLVLPAGSILRPAEIGGLLALGITELEIFKKPRVAVLSSGDEVISPEKKPLPGQVRDINSYSLSALVEQHGGIPQRYGILPDQEDKMAAALRQALAENDFAILTAGSSASTRDLTARVIQQMGDPGVLVHGVDVKPGKPTILAVCNGKPVIGLPGNPVSALVIAGLFVTPILKRLSGSRQDQPRPGILARLTINVSSQAGREDWIPVRLVRNDTEWLAEPIFYKSNLIFTLVQADGLICVPAPANGLPSGEMVNVIFL